MLDNSIFKNLTSDRHFVLWYRIKFIFCRWLEVLSGQTILHEFNLSCHHYCSLAKLLTSQKVLRGADGLAMVLSGSDVNKTEVSSVKLENRRTDRQIYE